MNRNIILPFIILFFLFSLFFSNPVDAVNFRVFYGLEGSATGDMDRHNNDTCTAVNTPWRCCTGLDTGTCNPVDQDMSIVVENVAGTITGYIYHFDGDSVEAENSPWFIRPDNYSSAGVWHLIDSFSLAPSTQPTWNFRDSDATDLDVSANIYANCTDVGSGTEDCDLYLGVKVGGTLTNVIQFDADGNVEILAHDLDLASGKVYKIDGTQITITNLGNFSSANLLGKLSDETGSGAAVFGTSPVLTSPQITSPNILTSIGLPANAVNALTEIATALKTGVDAKLVTGTAGTNTYVAVWNTDGDLVAGAGAPATTGTKLDDFATPDDNTDLDSSITEHGLLKKLNNNAATWMDGTGVWSAPTAAEVGAEVADPTILKEADYNAQTILHATTDDTPVTLTVTEQTVVGRATAGNIAALVIDSDLSAVSGSDDTIPSALATKTYADTKETADAAIAKTDEAETITVDWDFSSTQHVDGEVANILTLDELNLDALSSEPSTPALKKEYRADGITWDPTGNGLNKSHTVMIGATGTEAIADQVDRDFSGASDWTNVDINAYDETTDLTITATAIGQYATIATTEVPMTQNDWYVLEFDVANLTSTWTIYDFDAGFTIGTISANGNHQRILFKYTDASSGGIRLTSVATNSSADLDNFSLKEATWMIIRDEDGNWYVNTIQAAMNVITDADGIVLTASQMNSVIVMTGAGDVDIPADMCDSATGQWLTVKSTAAHLNSLTSNDASDLFVLSNGTPLDAQDELDLAGAAGSQVTVMCMQTNKWWVTGEIGTAVDGGAP